LTTPVYQKNGGVATAESHGKSVHGAKGSGNNDGGIAGNDCEVTGGGRPIRSTAAIAAASLPTIASAKKKSLLRAEKEIGTNYPVADDFLDALILFPALPATIFG
jgi:hypothetical protein